MPSWTRCTCGAWGRRSFNARVLPSSRQSVEAAREATRETLMNQHRARRLIPLLVRTAHRTDDVRKHSLGKLAKGECALSSCCSIISGGESLGIETRAAAFDPLSASEAQLRVRLELASRLGALAAGARDLAELFRALYGETARVMDATVFLFALYDEASETVQVVRQMDRGVEHSGGRVLGVLSAQSYRPEAYQDADLLSLSAIAAQAGITIQRLRVTEQMALEHERHALELEAVLATMNDALLIVDARGAIVRLNRAARELLCLDSASLVFGQPLEQQRLEQWPATAREIAAALVPVIDALRSGRSVADVEIELRSGQLRVLSLSASVLRSPKGAVQGGVVVFRDITGQRDLERLREDIFSMAWHDMKTPITVIRGHAELLLRRLSF